MIQEIEKDRKENELCTPILKETFDHCVCTSCSFISVVRADGESKATRTSVADTVTKGASKRLGAYARA